MVQPSGFRTHSRGLLQEPSRTGAGAGWAARASGSGPCRWLRPARLLGARWVAPPFLRPQPRAKQGRGVERKGAKARLRPWATTQRGTSGSGGHSATFSVSAARRLALIARLCRMGQAIRWRATIDHAAIPARDCPRLHDRAHCAAGTSWGGVDAPTASSEGNTSAAPTGCAPSTKKQAPPARGHAKPRERPAAPWRRWHLHRRFDRRPAAPAVDQMGAAVKPILGAGRGQTSASRGRFGLQAPQSRSTGSRAALAREAGAGDPAPCLAAKALADGRLPRWAEASNTCWQFHPAHPPVRDAQLVCHHLEQGSTGRQRVVWLMGCGL